MAYFTELELAILDALSRGKSAKSASNKHSDETIAEAVEGLKTKLGCETAADLPGRFVEFTGWSNRPSNYPA